MKKITLIILSALALLTACNTHNKTKLLDVKEIKIDTKNITELKFSDLYNNMDIIALQTDSGSLLGHIKKIITTERNIFILSNNKFFKFKRNGDFCCSYTKEGKGPGEYINLEDFYIDEANSQIELYDFTGKKIIILDNELNYLNMINAISISSFYKIDNENYILHHSSGFGDSKYKISLVDGDFNIKKEWFKLNKNFMHFFYYLDKNCFAKVGDDVHLHHIPYDTIYKVENNTLLPVYALNFNSDKLPFEYYNKKFNDIYEFYMYVKKTDYAYYVDIYGENEKYLNFTYEKKGQHFFTLYNKAKDSTIICDKIIDDIVFQNRISTISYKSVPAETTSNYHVYIQSANEILESINNGDSLNITNNNWIDKLNRFSNPVIMFAYFK